MTLTTEKNTKLLTGVRIDIRRIRTRVTRALKSPLNRHTVDTALHLTHCALQLFALLPREFGTIPRAADKPDWNFHLITFLLVVRLVDRGETGALPALGFPLNANASRGTNFPSRVARDLFARRIAKATRTPFGSLSSLTSTLRYSRPREPPWNGVRAVITLRLRLIVRCTRRFWYRCQNCTYLTYRDTHIVPCTSVSRQPVPAGPWIFAETAIIGGDRNGRRWRVREVSQSARESGTLQYYVGDSQSWCRIILSRTFYTVHCGATCSPCNARHPARTTESHDLVDHNWSGTPLRRERETVKNFPSTGLSRGVLATRGGKMLRKRRRGRNAGYFERDKRRAESSRAELMVGATNRRRTCLTVPLEEIENAVNADIRWWILKED